LQLFLSTFWLALSLQHSLRLKIQAKKNGWEAKRLMREDKYQRKQEEKENALRRRQHKAHKKQQRLELDAVFGMSLN
jgi:hypothetical protein